MTDKSPCCQAMVNVPALEARVSQHTVVDRNSSTSSSHWRIENPCWPCLSIYSSWLVYPYALIFLTLLLPVRSCSVQISIFLCLLPHEITLVETCLSPVQLGAEATHPMLHGAVFVFIQNVFILNTSHVQIAPKFYPALPLVLCNKPAKCEVDQVRGSQGMWVTVIQNRDSLFYR